MVCTSCGNEADEASQFCTACGQVLVKATQAPASPAKACPACGAPVETSSAFCTSCGQRLPAETPAPSNTAAATAPVSPATAAVPPPSTYQAPSQPSETSSSFTYQQPQQPDGGKFGLMVVALLVVIVGAGFGGWYFWGVETVIVCSPPDVRVFLDEKEVQPSSYGRYVVPHLSRQSHLLKVQSPGFADTIQKLDFPLTSAHEWVNIKLVPRRR